MKFIYLLVAFFASSVGAITGMGGGVIIKPVFDLIGTFDAQSIGVLSSMTVLSMAFVSAGRNIARKTPLPLKTASLVAIGSVVGGSLGQAILNVIVHDFANSMVIAIQNIILGSVILVVFVYMRRKDNLPSLKIKNNFFIVLLGLVLGILSSFLGIGGGPINVVAFIFFFSYTTKTAAISSLVTILFAQMAKLVFIGIDGGFSEVDLSALPFMIVGAIVGGFFGSAVSEHLDDKVVDQCFNAIQLLVLGFCVLNIIQNIA